MAGQRELPGAVASVGCLSSGVRGAGVGVAICCGSEYPGSGLRRWGDLTGPVVEGVGLWAVLPKAQYLNRLERTSGRLPCDGVFNTRRS